MIKIFIFGLFLLYYWYFYFSYSKPFPKPEYGAPDPSEPYRPPQFVFNSDLNRFQFILNNDEILWEETIPDKYIFHEQKLVEQDVCHGVLDGRKVLAKGLPLYNYLNEHPHLEDTMHFKNDARLVVQEGDVFYFTCHEQRIQALNMCPSGYMFSQGHCRLIQPCLGLPDGTLLPQEGNIFGYLRCYYEEGIPLTCPSGTFFMVSKCEPIKDVTYYCHYFNTSFLMNSKTRVDCVQGKPVYTTCPDGYAFFELDKGCEPDVCENVVDGTKYPLKIQKVGPFSFHPGYRECKNGRLTKPVLCPQNWNTFLSKGENLLHLPMVFHENQCTIPEFCTNVTSDEDIIVPVYEFTKHVNNWQHADYYDTLAGYKCENGQRKRVLLPPGQHINKRFKLESACNGDREFIPIFETPDSYFDCNAQQVQQCRDDEQFNGVSCQLKLPNSFQLNNLGIFQFNNLSHDNWIRPWLYSRTPSVEPCPDFSNKYIANYNLCSHPDCASYAFLSQIPSLSIHYKDNGGLYKCIFREEEGRLLTKEKVESESVYQIREKENQVFDFWLQRHVSVKSSCVFGQNIHTGHFIWDRTLYATCDDHQPFVFCPSSSTQGIFRVSNNKYACKMPSELNMTAYNEVHNTRFEPNEIEKIYPTRDKQLIEIKRNQFVTLTHEGLEIPEDDFVNLKVTEPVVLIYRYRVTHPPDVVYEQNNVKTTSGGGAFMVRRKDFTKMPIEFPNYEIMSGVSDLFQI